MNGVDDDICKRFTKKGEQMAKQLQNFFLSDLILSHSHRLQRRRFQKLFLQSAFSQAFLHLSKLTHNQIPFAARNHSDKIP